MNASLLSLMWFVVIVAAIPAALWLLKRSPMGATLGASGTAPVRVVASVAVGAQQKIVTVEVGTGEERRWLVLGVTAQQITTLHTLSAPPEQAGTQTQTPPSFASLLASLRGKRPEDRDAN